MHPGLTLRRCALRILDDDVIKMLKPREQHDAGKAPEEPWR